MSSTPPGRRSNLAPLILAAISGAAAYLAILYRFQTYTQRNHLPSSFLWAFAGVMWLAGLILSFVSGEPAKRVGTAAVIGVFAAHATIIAVDLHEDPTNHNLLPFEFVFYFVLSSPAYLGALVAGLLRRYR